VVWDTPESVTTPSDFLHDWDGSSSEASATNIPEGYRYQLVGNDGGRVRYSDYYYSRRHEPCGTTTSRLQSGTTRERPSNNRPHSLRGSDAWAHQATTCGRRYVLWSSWPHSADVGHGTQTSSGAACATCHHPMAVKPTTRTSRLQTKSLYLWSQQCDLVPQSVEQQVDHTAKTGETVSPGKKNKKNTASKN
jgi:hypothetical protein